MSSDNKMMFAIKGTITLINLMEENDYVSVITFDSHVEVFAFGYYYLLITIFIYLYSLYFIVESYIWFNKNY
jgi:hypothetical protein